MAAPPPPCGGFTPAQQVHLATFRAQQDRTLQIGPGTAPLNEHCSATMTTWPLNPSLVAGNRDALGNPQSRFIAANSGCLNDVSLVIPPHKYTWESAGVGGSVPDWPRHALPAGDPVASQPDPLWAPSPANSICVWDESPHDPPNSNYTDATLAGRTVSFVWRDGHQRRLKCTCPDFRWPPMNPNSNPTGVPVQQHAPLRRPRARPCLT